MKTKRIVALVIVVFHLCIMNTLNASESEQDVVVRFPPELGITQGVKSNNYSKAEEVMDELLQKIPSAPELGATSTIGQLTKKTDVIIVGKVIKIISSSTTATLCPHYEYEFKVEVVVNLHGKANKRKLNLKCDRETLKGEINAGDSVIFFLSTDRFFVDIKEFELNYQKPPSSKNKELLVFHRFRGVLELTSPYQEDEVYKAVNSYISLLRNEKRDYSKYYNFLKNVTKTQNRRLIEDGNSDMLFLLRTCDEINLYELLNDEELDPNIKEYIRVVMIPHKENKLKQEAEQ